MSSIDKLMVAAAEVLRLKVEQDYESGVRANLEVAVKMAALVEAVELDDDTETAPVYRP